MNTLLPCDMYLRYCNRGIKRNKVSTKAKPPFNNPRINYCFTYIDEDFTMNFRKSLLDIFQLKIHFKIQKSIKLSGE